MKRMLFNATQAEELRVAIVDGQKLIDLDIESASKEQRKSNIYKGIITRVEPSLEAVFVDYGEERHGFLPFKAIARSYLQHGSERGRIQDILKEGQQLIVQVDKDERGNKGAALSTFISLAGRYLVLMPNNPRGGGISRRVDGEDRVELREVMDQLEVPAGMSLITRTAAIGRQAEELQWDLNYLKQLWNAIEAVARNEHTPRLLYQEDSLVIRAIRDYFQPEIGEILIDTDSIYQQARDFMSFVIPNDVHRVKRYWDDVPLFSRFQIEHQIETAFGRQVNLPSGGAIVIDHTEALVAIDINSGRATRGADIEETAFKTNLEAAEEIARQLRLRDLGGLIVIDFIDMESAKNQREVENRLKEALKFDRARVQVGKISRFGLMELSRQRLRPALAETSYIPCPRCTGTGHIRSTESAALHILRILEEESMKEGTAAVHVQVPVDVATFLLNEKRQDIQVIESRHKVSLLLIPNMHLETPAHSIARLKHEDLGQEERLDPSYRMVKSPEEEKAASAQGKQDQPRPRQEAVLKNLAPEQPAPIVKAPEEKGFISRFLSLFMGKPAETPPPAKKPREKNRGTTRDADTRNEKRESRGDGRGDGRGEGRRGKARNENRKEEREEREARGEEKSARTNRNERNNEARSRRAEPVNTGAEEARETPREPRRKREQAKPANVVPQTEVSVLTEGEETTAQGKGRNRRGRNRGAANTGAEASADVSVRSAEFIVQPEALNESEPLARPKAFENTWKQGIPLEDEAITISEMPILVSEGKAKKPAPDMEARFSVAPDAVSVMPVIKPVTPVVEQSVSVLPPVVSVAQPRMPEIVQPPSLSSGQGWEASPAGLDEPGSARMEDMPDAAPLGRIPAVSATGSATAAPVTAAPIPTAPVVTATPAAPVAMPLPTVEQVAATLEESGLVLVQTHQTPPATPVPEATPVGRPRRRSSASRADEEAMVMVETQQ